MLFKYKKAYEKIAMGLLSFMPEEKDIKVLQQTIKQYEEDENWCLYLWKNDEDFIGVVGVIVDEQTLHVKHLSVNPSYRNLGIATKMIESLIERYEGFKLVPTQHTESFLKARILTEA